MMASPARSDQLVGQLHDLWADALGVEVHDQLDFFEAGGDSLVAMRIIGEATAMCGTRVTLRALFDNSRFGEFVDVIARLQETPTAGPRHRLPRELTRGYQDVRRGDV